MATLLLTAVGTAVGGPIGGAIGGLIGRQVDGAVLGNGAREGPRLKELAVTTSSYGQPIPRIFGRMRVAGTIIWATDLVESKRKEGGGKGKPSTTTYSYSASFAVSVSSTPIGRIGRIWADGNLLRGANGDLKVEGELRSYLGHGDDGIDPIIAADKGLSVPAFRDCSYVVFENLALGDFGNRIPALTFEVFGERENFVTLADLVPSGISSNAEMLEFAKGIADDGSSIHGTLTVIDQAYPIACITENGTISLRSKANIPPDPPTLPEQLGHSGSRSQLSHFRQRIPTPAREPVALRYYDEQRDYQPGVQSADGQKYAGRERMIDLPVTMAASGAKQLANANVRRQRWRRDVLLWRVGTLDDTIRPGSVVKVPGNEGYWYVQTWEWLDSGLELTLHRLPPAQVPSGAGDPGAINPPGDLVTPGTSIAAFELPTDGSHSPDTRLVFAGLSAENPAWKGAALFVEDGDTLLPIGSSGSERAVIGRLGQNLGASAGTLFEPNAVLEVVLDSVDLTLVDTDLSGIANGANRLLVGGEILQFQRATPLGNGRWNLSGLLRGGGGTEDIAVEGHAAGTEVILLDERIIQLELPSPATSGNLRIAAIGRGDEDPVYAAIGNAGRSRRPLAPVHPRTETFADGTNRMSWTRRARSVWRWETLFDLPLIEQQERYEVGLGPVDDPFMTWSTDIPEFSISITDLDDAISVFGPSDIWVRQIGTYSTSSPLILTSLS